VIGHTPHADIALGLQPGCPGCEEIASSPVTRLDERNIVRLLVDRQAFTALDEIALAGLERAYREGERLRRLVAGDEQ